MGHTMIGLTLAAMVTGCQAETRPDSANHPVEPVEATPSAAPAFRVVDLTGLPSLEAIIPRLAEHRAVLVGESHDRYEHHLVQLEIIRALHRRDPQLAVGLEFFQQPFQRYLDDYVSGAISEAEMLKGTEYFDRWRYDYRFYQPILQYAREHGLPLVALNVAAELTEKVARGGLEALDESERATLPDEFTPYPEEYQRQLRSIYDQHPPKDGRSFDNFVMAQLLWDEGMAARAADWLRGHPGQRMVILAGSGHVQYGAGIPSRLEQRLGISTAVVVNGTAGGIEPGIADFVVLPESRELPPPGRMGIIMTERNGAVTVDELVEQSAASAAGIEVGDRLVEVAGQEVDSLSDVHVAMFGRKPGETVAVRIHRNFWFGRGNVRDYTVTLK